MSITDKNNRILIISGWYLPLIGGYIKVVHELALKLIEIGYNVDILTSNSNKEIGKKINQLRVFISLLQQHFLYFLFNILVFDWFGYVFLESSVEYSFLIFGKGISR